MSAASTPPHPVVLHAPATLIGLSALALPTALTLTFHALGTTGDPQALLVLMSGIVLLAYKWPREHVTHRPASEPIGWAVRIILGIGYVFGRAYDVFSLELGALLALLTLSFQAEFGWQALRSRWFLFVYLALAAPLPGTLVNAMTNPMKMALSWLATVLLHGFGFPVARQGVTIYISQYQLLVEDACAGLNTLLSLAALCLCYIYLTHPQRSRATVAMVLMVLPAALLANFVRIVLLILITYYVGNDVAQSIVHQMAGLLMFVIALGSLIALDRVMSRPQRDAI